MVYDLTDPSERILVLNYSDPSRAAFSVLYGLVQVTVALITFRDF